MTSTTSEFLTLFNDRPLVTGFLILTACFGIYILALSVYRLFLCPVASFPGPKLAALTFWYEFYYDVLQSGQYTFEIERMHKKYGPIVRINPYELHVNDPDFYEILYAGPSKHRDKWSWSYNAFGNPLSGFGTIDHEHHRVRRAVLNPYFSRRSISQLEPSIRELVNLMCRRIREWQKLQAPLKLQHLYAALTIDVITEYCFANSYDCLNSPDFSPSWIDSAYGLAKGGHFMNQFPWMLPIMLTLPNWLVVRLNPLMANLINLQGDLRVKIAAIMKSSSKDSMTSHPTIFHEVLQSDIPPEEKALERLVQEGQVMVAAGQATTSDTLEMTSYHLLSNPDCLKRLKSELETAMPNPNELASFQQLEQLPYLSAVINEGLRLTCPIVSRLQRVCPDEALTFQKYTIPPGTPVGMSSYFMHLRNEKCFPEPTKFVPERWLVPASQRRQMERCLVPFSKGTRMCLGMNLAQVEMYLGLAAVFRRFDMELYDTPLENVAIASDFFIPLPKEGSERVRVLVKE